MKKKINSYKCSDGHEIITIDTDEGLPLSIITCKTKGCSRFSHSQLYKCSQYLKPEYEWYKPNVTDKLTMNEFKQVNLGHLLLRKISNTKHELIPGSVAKDIAREFGYTEIVISAFDSDSGIKTFCSYGKSHTDKDSAASLIYELKYGKKIT